MRIKETQPKLHQLHPHPTSNPRIFHPQRADLVETNLALVTSVAARIVNQTLLSDTRLSNFRI